MKLASGTIEDGVINRSQAEFIQKWIMTNAGNSFIRPILKRLDDIFSNNYIFTEEEIMDFLLTLSHFSGEDLDSKRLQRVTPQIFTSDFGIEEIEEMKFEGKMFCFTGTFEYGNREECEQATKKEGGLVGDLTEETDYLVVGTYFVRSKKVTRGKILRYKHEKLEIISEEYWKKKLTSLSISDFLR